MKNDAICTKGCLDWECSPKMVLILKVIQEVKWLNLFLPAGKEVFLTGNAYGCAERMAVV